MTQSRPTVFTIPAGVSFADTLAEGILARYGDDPLSLSAVTLLLPNRRAVRALREAFLRQLHGRPLLLPAMRPIGDMAEGELEFLGAGLGLDLTALRPPISPLRRQILLMQLVAAWQPGDGREGGLAPAQTWRLAGELAALIDQVDTARLSFDRLAELAPESLAAHWNDTVEFLSIVTQHWPAILETEAAQDAAAYRNETLAALAGIYKHRPPAGPLIAAGSTGSIPATADLLRVVARLPDGHVILPAFEPDQSDEIWAALDDTHPQAGMKRLLETMGVSRHEVTPWQPIPPLPQARRLSLLRDSLLPATLTDSWRETAHGKIPNPDLFAGLEALVAPNRREEAEAIAVMLRELLETPGATGTLITPDRQLALYVRAALRRWSIEIDDSGGDKALNSLPGRLLALVAAAAGDDFGPRALLELLQHPLVACGMARDDFLAVLRRLDVHLFRGVRPAGGLKGLQARAAAIPETRDWPTRRADVGVLRQIAAALAPLEACLASAAALPTVLDKHIRAAESLCASETDTGADRLWRGDAGSALGDRLADLLGDADKITVPTPESYTSLFAEIVGDLVVRPRWNRHPRIAIWGPLEARLQQADLVILGGLNEGVWPAEPARDPWMSRSMRASFGLPPLERRIGQAAHDFWVAAAAPRVVLTRSEKTDGTPTVSSRWWFRLEALAGRAIPRADRYAHWAAALTAPDTVRPVLAPRPTPPVSARPRKLSVTQVQEWMRDPYAIYARKILGLTKLDPIDDRPNAAQKGTLLHEALELFLVEEGPLFGPEGLARLMKTGERVFAPVLTQPTVYAFWWPRFERIARWFVENEAARQERYEPAAVEAWAKAALGSGLMPEFTLIAKADRIDRNRDTGGLVIIDYKTGEVPGARQVEAGYAPQLPLEGWLAEQGAFEGLAAGAVEDLIFWKLSGGDPVQQERRPVKEVDASIAQAIEGLRRLVEAFANPDTPYLSNPRPAITGYGDYDHLARVREWRNAVDPLLMDGEGDP